MAGSDASVAHPHLAPTGPAPARARSLLAVIRRFRWASAALALLVLLAAAAQYAASPRVFVAARELRVAVVPGTAPGSRDDATDAAARGLTTPAFLASDALANAILAGLPSGERERQGATLPAIAGALSATHAGASVTLVARWATATGAEEILAAAIAALQREPALLPSPATAGDTVRVQAVGAATPATPAADREEAARQTLLYRIVLGLLAAPLLPFALAWLAPARLAPARSATGAVPATTRKPLEGRG